MQPPANNENLSLCAQCGGACCRTQPGIDHPERFLAAADPTGLLASLLADHNWVLSLHPWRDEESGDWLALYYPRPAKNSELATNSQLALDDTSPCVFLTPTGCRLTFAERPYLCQTLEPMAEDACHSPWGKRDAAIAWRPHQELIHAAVEMLQRPPLARSY